MSSQRRASEQATGAGASGWARIAHDEHVWEIGLLVLIVVVALVLRVYRLPELLILGPDQGRDALVVEHMLRTGQPVLEGSPTYVVFDPPDYANGATFGGVIVDDVRWVRLEPASAPT